MPAKKRPSTPSPKPAPRKRGKPPFIATREQRLTVEFMAGAGIREDEMVRVVLNPATNEPISPVTLRKHFRQELDRGHTKADMMVAQALYKNATTATDTYPGGIPVAQIFWLKTRARWRTADKPSDLPPPPPVTPEQMDARETARRMAFLLAAGAAQLEHEERAKAQPPKPKTKISA